MSYDGRQVTLVASGDNGNCGTAKSYVLTVDGAQHALSTAPAAAGTKQTIDVSALVEHAHSVLLSAQDAAGNLSFPVVLAGPQPHADVQPASDFGGVNTHGGSLPTRLVAAHRSSVHARLASFAVDADLALLALVAALLGRQARRRVTR